MGGDKRLGYVEIGLVEGGWMWLVNYIPQRYRCFFHRVFPSLGAPWRTQCFEELVYLLEHFNGG